uniref:Leukotriene B4 receptor 1-like n=2 Tax=Lepisosteus oculatus TaxID=7918 RepID=W5NM49_LEPOC
MNTTSYNFSSSDAYSAPGGSLICVILGLCFLVGAPGNLLVMWTILRHVRPRSHTVLLILNLAAADLLVLITVPIWIYSFAASWVFGEAVCKAIVYMIYSSMYSSVFLISSLSVERFVAVLYPFALQNWRRKGVMTKVLVAIWILAFMFGTPVILTHTVGGANGTQYCTFQEFSSDSQEMVCLVLETLVGFVIPFSVLSICYTCVGRQIRQLSFKTKQKSAVLIVSVVIAFVVCWFPHHVLNMIRLASLLQDHPEELEEFVHNAVFIFGALAFVSSSVNPVLYAFAARRFRSGMRESRLTKLFQEITTHTSGARGPATLSSGRSNTCNLALECKTSA